MKTKSPKPAPTPQQLGAALKSAATLWDEIVATFSQAYAPLEVEWKAAKTDFGAFCRLKHHRRTLLYLLPTPHSFEVAVVLGEKAAAAAANSPLPSRLKQLVADARPYVEGRGIRFHPTSSDVGTLLQLVELKLAPQTA